MTSYAAPATYGGYAAPQMSYVPPMQGAYGQTAHPYLDEKTITEQKDQATKALQGNAEMQEQMIDHQYKHQVGIIDAECARNCDLAKNQFVQQAEQAKLALSQQKQQQEMQLKMEQQQREMAITQQAASPPRAARPSKHLCTAGG